MPGMRGQRDQIGLPGRSSQVARILWLAVCSALFSTGCLNLELPGGRRGELQESVVYGADLRRADKVLLLDIDGEIINADRSGLLGISRESTVSRVREQLDKARKDSDIKAILLRIDSPGGSATASEQVYHDIVRFKKERDVPVVAQMLSMAASGGYYIAMAADEIQAHPTTVTGSIGVIFFGLNFSGLMEKLGVEDQTLTAGTRKDVGSSLRPMRAEERAQLESVLNDLHARFRDVVAGGRPDLSAEEILAVSDGSIFSAPQALEKGLVDRIGTVEEAVKLAGKRAGLDRVQVVAYHRSREWRRNLYTRAPLLPTASAGPGVPVDLGALLPRIRPGFHYLWWPGAH